MTDLKLTLTILPGALAICRLSKDAQVPDWARAGDFCSITRAPEELSIVCPQANVSDETKCETGWRCLGVKGPLDFSLTGVVASLAEPLAQAGISIFVVSTYDTDYLLVKEENLERAVAILCEQGHRIEPPPS